MQNRFPSEELLNQPLQNKLFLEAIRNGLQTRQFAAAPVAAAPVAAAPVAAAVVAAPVAAAPVAAAPVVTAPVVAAAR
jgi:hypothetical protein